MNVRTLVISASSIALLTGSLIGGAHSPAGATLVNAVLSCNKPNHTACLQWTNHGAGGYGILGSWGLASLPDIEGGVVGSTAGTGTASSAGLIGISNGAMGEALFAYGDGSLAVNAAVDSANTGAPIVNLANNLGTNTFIADDSGNVHITGQIYTAGGCSTGCSIIRRVISYGARTTTPSLDDTGEAVLREGRTFVTLDPALTRAIDTASYIVTLTPEGDSNGLYVAARTSHGFEVRESHNGHSTLTFAYRIVAHPFGSSGTRLPLVDLKPAPGMPIHR
jgi:hypothetical protein